MANELVLPSPVSSFIQGQQAAQANQMGALQLQQARDAQQRDAQFRQALPAYLTGGTNALAALYTADPERAMQAQNFMVQQNQLAQAQTVAKAKVAHAQAVSVLQSAAPAQYLRTMLPQVADQWAQHNGKSPDELTDEDAKALASEVAASAGAQAGIETKPITVGKDSTVLMPTDTGEYKPVFTSPEQPITPYQQEQLNIDRGKLSVEQQKLRLAESAANPFGVGGVGGAGPGVTASQALTGEDYLKTLPQNIATQVKALAEGRMQFPGGFALKSPYWQQMISAVSQYDPSFDAVNYNARAKTRSDFTSGKNAQNIKSLNTAIGHLGTLSEQLSGTASHNFTPLNFLQNKTTEAFGSAGPTKFKQTASALASELTQVFRGSGGAEADVKRYLEELNVDASQEQKRAAVKNIVELLHSRLNAIGDQYSQGMGTTADPLTLLNPKAQHVITRLDALTSGSEAPSEIPPPAITPTGPISTGESRNVGGFKVKRVK